MRVERVYSMFEVYVHPLTLGYEMEYRGKGFLTVLFSWQISPLPSLMNRLVQESVFLNQEWKKVKAICWKKVGVPVYSCITRPAYTANLLTDDVAKVFLF